MTPMPIKRWVDKQTVMLLHNAILFTYKKEWFHLNTTSWTGFEDIMLTEISQTQKAEIG